MNFEHYKFDGEESSMHLEWRARQGKGRQRMIRTVQECMVWLLGVGLGLLVGSMTIASRVHPATCPPPCPHPTPSCPRTQPSALTSLASLTYPHLPSPALTSLTYPSGAPQLGHVGDGPGAASRGHRGGGLRGQRIRHLHGAQLWDRAPRSTAHTVGPLRRQMGR